MSDDLITTTIACLTCPFEASVTLTRQGFLEIVKALTRQGHDLRWAGFDDDEALQAPRRPAGG